MYKFENVILIVVFNYSDCICNNLLVNNVIAQKDIDILNKWNTYFVI